MGRQRADKEPFRIGVAMKRVRAAVRPYPKAAMFELAEEGHNSVFELLIGCIVSIRTLDEVTLPAARRLFARAPTPAAVAALTSDEILACIRPSVFAEPKAERIREIARRTVEEHGGTLPCDADVLTAFHGVGPKCANLVLGIACAKPVISVDIHVHRITNRWGYVAAKTPEKTMKALEAKLPKRYWVEINALLVPFGKHICTGSSPKCSTCPLLAMCRQVGVKKHR